MTTLKFPPNDEFMSFCRTEGFPNNYNDCLKATLQNDLGSSNPSIGDLMRAHFDRFQDDDYFSVANEAFRIIKSYGTDAHVYLPGIGVINGLTAGNYLDSAGTTLATVDNPVGLVIDAANSQLGSELTSPIFNNAGLWVPTGTASATGVLSFSVSGGAGGISKNGNNYFTAGKYYDIALSYTKNDAITSFSLVQIDNASASSPAAFSVTAASGTVSARIFAVSGGVYFRLSNTGSITINSISVKEVTGIHALQATTANKPILRLSGGKYSWQFDGTDSLALGSVPFQMADDHCVIAGVANSLSTTGTAFAISNLAGTSYISIIQIVAGGRIIAYWKSDAGITVTCDAGSWALNENAVVSTRQTANTRIARKNGVTNETKTTSLGATTVSKSAIGVWDKTAPANYLNGRTFPIIAIKGAVTDADLLILEKFVGSLSGVTI